MMNQLQTKCVWRAKSVMDQLQTRVARLVFKLGYNNGELVFDEPATNQRSLDFSFGDWTANVFVSFCLAHTVKTEFRRPWPWQRSNRW